MQKIKHGAKTIMDVHTFNVILLYFSPSIVLAMHNANVVFPLPVGP
jgi:hypothetical protein